MWQDNVNGVYEFLGGFFILANCWKLLKDKKVKGISIIAVIFFTSWGCWNLYYYPSLNQWWSFAGGIGIVLANILWISMMLHYIRKENNDRYNIS